MEKEYKVMYGVFKGAFNSLNAPELLYSFISMDDAMYEMTRLQDIEEDNYIMYIINEIKVYPIGTILHD